VKLIEENSKLLLTKRKKNLIFYLKKKKDNFKVYKCIEYKTLNKSKYFIILNDKNDV